MPGSFCDVPRPVAVLTTAFAALFLTQCDRDRPEPVDAAPIVAEADTAVPEVVVATTLNRASLLAATSRAAAAYAAGERMEGPTPWSDAASDPRPVRLQRPPAHTGRGRGRRSGALGLGPRERDHPAEPHPRRLAQHRPNRRPGRRLGLGDGRGLLDSPPVDDRYGMFGRARRSAAKRRPLAVAPDRRPRRGFRRRRFPRRPPQRPGLCLHHPADGDEPLEAPTGGYRVVLEGRLASFPDGRAIRCRASSPDQRPVCIAAIRLDRVAFTNADASVLLSEWRTG